MNEWMNEWINEWINEWVNKWMDEWMNEWMNARAKEWINKGFIPGVDVEHASVDSRGGGHSNILNTHCFIFLSFPVTFWCELWPSLVEYNVQMWWKLASILSILNLPLSGWRWFVVGGKWKKNISLCSKKIVLKPGGFRKLRHFFRY